MQKQSLSGVWELIDSEGTFRAAGHLPGCNFLDMLENGIIEDPFWGQNEKEMLEYVKKNYEYLRSFDLAPGMLANDKVELVMTGLDTLTEIQLNGRVIANTDNVHRTYRFSVKELLQEKDNHIRIRFFSPLPYLEDKNREDNLKIHTGMGIEGISHIRKVQCHFGWDWGPVLPPVGISGKIELQGHSIAGIGQVSIKQEHKPEKVILHINTEITSYGNRKKESKSLENTEADNRKISLKMYASGLWSEDEEADYNNSIEEKGSSAFKAMEKAGNRVSDRKDSGPVSDNIEFIIKTTLLHPSGKSETAEERISDTGTSQSIEILNPELWWCNGLGNQPLYQITVELFAESRLLDTLSKNIGLRTIELDTGNKLNTDPDSTGDNFRFLINGVPIFAKGADWIPSDSFITRTRQEDLEFYIAGAKNANMNMLRVWGGGYYESEAFYDLCDRYGILVWQDFCFACLPYPFYNKDFLDNVEKEVIDNVRRIKHHPSLALWCGNNEIELMSMLWRKNLRLKEANNEFFHVTLRKWVNREDEITPYWPGSPNSGTPQDKPNDFYKGDTHLWQVWHGMRPIEYFRKMPTRFCSEFGMESLPSIKAVRSFTDNTEPDIFEPVMLAHQKSKGGNQKMLFYLLAKFRNPVSFRDFIYLSQLVQSETIREATEEWKRNIGRCNGAIYWQYNDCWPVASWAGIDYEKQYKAVLYSSKIFNRLLSASLDLKKDRADIYIVNEYPRQEKVKLRCIIEDFSGKTVWQEERDIEIAAVEAVKALGISLKTVLKGSLRTDKVLIIQIIKDGEVVFSQNRLLVPDKEARLKKGIITKELIRKGNQGILTLKADTYTRYVCAALPGVDAPLSDNYFDIRGNDSYTVTFDMPEGITEAEFLSGIELTSLAHVPYKGNKLTDKFLRLAMRLHKDNILAWIIFHFI